MSSDVDGWHATRSQSQLCVISSGYDDELDQFFITAYWLDPGTRPFLGYAPKDLNMIAEPFLQKHFDTSNDLKLYLEGLMQFLEDPDILRMEELL